MASATISEQAIAACWASVQRAAAAGEPCPHNDVDGVSTDTIRILAERHFIRALISGKNWRCVQILKGPHAGKSTLADPKGGRIYKIIGAFGTQMIRKPAPPGQPSAPRLLTDPRNSDDAPTTAPRGQSG